MNENIVNYPSKINKYIEMRDKIQSKNVEFIKYPSYFNDIISNKDRQTYVDFKSATMNRFYPLKKNPQINCVEPFIRGGQNSVLLFLDNYKC